MPRKNTVSDESAVATLPAPSPAEIAEKVSAFEADRRRGSVVDAVHRWRELIEQIADGHEPNGAELGELADLAARLRLPTGAVADHVAAITQDRKYDVEIQTLSGRIAATKDREKELRDEFKVAQARLRQLQQEHENYLADHMSLPGIIGSRNETRARLPVVFADAVVVAERVLSAETSMSREIVGRRSVSTETWEG